MKRTPRFSDGAGCEASSHSGLADEDIINALERLKNTKDYLKEQYREQVKKCPYAELKPIAKQTYEDNKKAFDIAIKAIEEFTRQKAEIERLKATVDSFTDIGKLYSEIKAEAIKEYVDWLTSELIAGGIYPAFVKGKVEKVKKEMVGDV